MSDLLQTKEARRLASVVVEWRKNPRDELPDDVAWDILHSDTIFSRVEFEKLLEQAYAKQFYVQACRTVVINGQKYAIEVLQVIEGDPADRDNYRIFVVKEAES